MRKSSPRFAFFRRSFAGNGALLACVIMAFFGMATPVARAQFVTNALGFAKSSDYVMEAEGQANLMVVRKQGTRGAVQVEVQLNKDASTNAITGWTTNVIVTLRDNQLSALVPFTPKDNTLTNVVATNSVIKFSLVNPKALAGEDPIFTPILATGFTNTTINLVNDDDPFTFVFTKINNSGTEGKDVTVRVQLAKAPKDVGAKDVSVQYKVDEIPLSDLGAGASTATKGSDFDAVPLTTLTFADDETFKDIVIPLTADTEVEFPEELEISLSKPAGTKSDPMGADVTYNVPNPAWARIRIINDATAPESPVAAGSVDRTFNPENQPPLRLKNPGTLGPVAAVVVDKDSNTYLGGAFTSVNGNPRQGIARVDTTGQLDTTTFKPTGVSGGAVSALQLYSTGANSGKVLVGGSFTAVNGIQSKSVGRLNADGTTDTSFQIGAGADKPVYALGLEDNGDVLVGGAFRNFNNISKSGIVRLKSNGDVDVNSFQGVDINGPVFAILVTPVQAPAVQLSMTLSNAVAPFPPVSGDLKAKNGQLSLTYNAFDEGDHVQVMFGTTVILDKVLTNNFMVVTDPNTSAMTTNWIPVTLNFTLGPSTAGTNTVTIRVVPTAGANPANLTITATASPTGTGGITVGGDFTMVNGVPCGGIVRFTAAGDIDASFTAKNGSGADGAVNALAQQSNGGIIVGGGFDTFNNVFRGGITRLLADGTQDLTFGSGIGADDSIHSLVVDTNSDKIYVGGEFTAFNGTPRNFLARLYPDGTLDTGFMDSALNQYAGFPNLSGLAVDGPQGYLATVALTPDGDVMVGGLFNQVAGGSTRTEVHPRQNFARLVGGSTRGPGNFEITQPLIPWDENGGGAPISFHRVAHPNETNDLGTAEALIQTFDGAAVAGLDYTATTGIYSLLPTGNDPTIGSRTGNPVLITINDDKIIEGTEDFFVDVLSVDGVIDLGGETIRPGVAFGTITEATVAINDDDTPPILIGFAKAEYDVSEDDGVATIEVYRTGNPNQTVTVDYQVRQDTGPFAATPGIDFRTETNKITFPAGITNATFNVTILDDKFVENDETVSLRLARPNFGAQLDTNAVSATLNIIDNDLLSGKLDFTSSAYKVVEGQPFVEVQVRRAGGSVGRLTVDYTTVDGTAKAGEDYLPVSGTLAWDNLVTTNQTIRIPIVDNDLVESDEQFSLQLLNPSTPGIIGNLHANPVVTIKDNDFYGELSFSVADYFADEDGGNAVIQVVRRNGKADTVKVDFSTAAGTAVPGNDYTNVSGTLTFLPGETAKTFVVPIVDDTITDSNRTVTLNLSSPVKATLGVQSTATLTIFDDETVNIPAGDVERDFAIGTGADARVNALWLQNDGPTNSLRKIILAGDFSEYDQAPRQKVARVDDAGILDARYANGLQIDGTVRTILGTSDGKLVIGGDFQNVDNLPANHISRLNAVGHRDTLFDIGSGTDGTVNALAETFVGEGTNKISRIIVGGAYTVFNSVSRARIALVGEDGKVDLSFDPGVGADLAITSLAAQRDGKIIVGGLFTKWNGAPHRGIVRLNLDGTLDPAFDQAVAVNGTIRSIVIQADDKILIGGEFTKVDDVARAGVARLNLDGTLDLSFDPGIGADGPVLSMSLQQDGNIVVGGDFVNFAGVGRPHLTRLLPNGLLDLDINFGIGANGTVAAVASQYDRKIVIGGDFTEVNGVPRNRFARLFGGSLVGPGRVEFFVPDYVVSETNGVAHLIVVRSGGTETTATVDYFSSPLTATPNEDYQDVTNTLTFKPGESAHEILLPILDDSVAEDVETVLVTLTNVVGAAVGRQQVAHVNIISDDSVFSFSQPEYIVNEGIPGGQAIVKVIREGDLSFPVTVTVNITPGTASSPADFQAGNVQLLFTPGESTKNVPITIVNDTLGEGDETVNLHLSTGSGGRALPGLANAVLIIGDDDFHPGFFTFASTNLATTENAGTVTFTVLRTSGSQGAASVKVDTSSGSAIEDTDYTGFHGILNFAEGQTSNTFNVSIINDKAVEATETFKVTLSAPTGGALGTIPQTTISIADDDIGPGSLDTSFNPGSGADQTIYSMVLQDDGKIVVGGAFLNFSGRAAPHIARLTVNGTNDTSFSVGQGPNGTVYSLAQAAQGAISVGGDFRVFNSADHLYFTRILASGALDSSMVSDPGLNGAVHVVTRQADNNVLVGGDFTVPANRIGRVHASGTFDPSFNTGNGANGPVYDAQPTANGNVIIGGDFSNVGSQQRSNIARLTPDGHVDLQFTTSANGIVRRVFPLPDGRILIGGEFTQVNGTNVNYLAMLNTDGTLDTTFKDGQPDGPVYAIARHADGRIVVAGDFANAGTKPRNHLARLNPDGTLDNTFDPALAIDGIVYDVEVQPDNKILIAGAFKTVNGFARAGIARLNGLEQPTEFPVTATVTANASQLQIKFDSLVGYTYELQSSSDFLAWKTEQTTLASGGPAQFNVSIPGAPGNLFYRIVQKATP